MRTKNKLLFITLIGFVSLTQAKTLEVSNQNCHDFCILINTNDGFFFDTQVSKACVNPHSSITISVDDSVQDNLYVNNGDGMFARVLGDNSCALPADNTAALIIVDDSFYVPPRNPMPIAIRVPVLEWKNCE